MSTSSLSTQSYIPLPKKRNGFTMQYSPPRYTQVPFSLPSRLSSTPSLFLPIVSTRSLNSSFLIFGCGLLSFTQSKKALYSSGLLSLQASALWFRARWTDWDRVRPRKNCWRSSGETCPARLNGGRRYEVFSAREPLNYWKNLPLRCLHSQGHEWKRVSSISELVRWIQ